MPPLFPYLAARQNAGLLAEGELVIDNFAGWGGASTGMEAALGRPVDHAINHDPVAVSMHRINHPHSHHSVENVWEVDPLEVTRGQPVALCWFSPTCTHFSKAKGSALLDRGIRGLAWVAVRWADLVRPRVIMLENVEEFQTWGPLTKEGRPDPKQKGRTFNSFVNALRYLGYEVEWRELRACDYGAPTIRKRLFLIARCDGLPIVWPDPTHAAPADPRVIAGELAPHRAAAECIDWDLPCPSIFDRKKPLVANTMNRVAQGLRRFVLQAEQPYIVTPAQGLPDPLFVPCVVNKQFGNAVRDVRQPLSTVTTNHNKNELMAAQLVTYYGTKNAGETRGQNTTEPLRTQTTENRHALVTAHLVRHMGGGLAPEHASASVGQPARTILAGGGPLGLVSGALLKTDNQRSWGACVYPVTGQLPTVVSKNSHALTTAYLTAYYSQNGKGDAGQPSSAPLRTVPTHDRFGVTAVSLFRQFGTSRANTVTTPAPTVMTTGSGKLGVITARCVHGLEGSALARAQEVHDFLLQYLGAEVLAPYSRDGVVVLTVRGELYILADIGLRMLTPRELARCQGVPDTYVLDTDAEGKPVSKARQVRGIGNMVCPDPAQAITFANLSLQLPQAVA